MFNFMVTLRYNNYVSTFNVFLFNKYIFSSITGKIKNTLSYSYNFFSYFYLLKILRSFGLTSSLKNLKDFI